MRKQNSLQTVELPPGVKHYVTQVIADSWEAYDSLLVDDGWEHCSWWVGADSKRVPASHPGARLHEHREAVVRGHRIVVFMPGPERPQHPTVQVIRDIVEESMRP